MPTIYHVRARELAEETLHKLWPVSEYSMGCEQMAVKLIVEGLRLPELLEAKDKLDKLEQQKQNEK
jgi:hypothetical protein